MKKLILFLLLFTVTIATKAQFTTGWDKAMNFGGAGADVEEMRYVGGDLYFFARMMGKYQFAGVTYDAGAFGSYPDQDLIFGKITSAGTQVLLNRFKSADLSVVTGATRVGADGSLYIFRLGLGAEKNFGSLTAPAYGLQILKIGADGQFNWVKKINTFSDIEFGTSGVASPNFFGMQVKDNGEIYAIFKSNTIRGAVYPARVIKFNDTGDEVWNYEMTSTSSGTSTDGIAINNMPRQFVDDSGNVTFKVATTGTISFAGETLPYEEPYTYSGYGNLKNWIISLDNTGAKKWSTSAYVEPTFYGVSPTSGEIYINYTYSRQSPAVAASIAPFSALPNLAPPPALSYLPAVYSWSGIITLSTSGAIVKTKSNYANAIAYPTQMRIADNGRMLLYSATAKGNVFKAGDNFITFNSSGYAAMEVDADFNPITVFKLPAGSVVAVNGNQFAFGGSFKTAVTIGNTTLVPNYIDTDFNTRFPMWASIKADVLIAEGNLDNVPLTPETTTWTGSTSTDWNTASNWTNGVPTESVRASFSGTPTNLPVNIPNASKAGQISVQAGTELKLPAGYGAIAVTDRVFNDGKITVENANFLFSFFGASEIKGSGEFYFKGVASVYNFTGKISNTVSFDNTLEMSGATVNSLKFIGANAKFKGDVTVSNPAETAITGATAASNFVNGKLTRAVNPSGTYLFPIGTGSGTGEKSTLVNFTPNNLIGTTTLSVSYYSGSPTNGTGGGAPNLIVNGSEVKDLLNGGYLTVLPNQQPTGGNYGLGFSVTGSSNTVADPLKYVLIKRDNSSSPWVFQGANTVAPTMTGTGTAAVVKVSASDITSFSDFAIGIGNSIVTLPVNLVKFVASADAKSANLHWETASELDNDKFEIERSINGIDFVKIGEVKGSGNSSKFLNYNFKDYAPANGLNYYRLKQVDFNGKSDYSDIKFVDLNFKESVFSVYPNPVADMVNFSEEVKAVEIYSQQGALLLRKINRVTYVEIPDEITTGIYILKLKTATGETLNKRILISK